MKRITIVLTAVFTALALAVPAGAGEPVIPDGNEPAAFVPDEWVNETPTAWFVQLASPPAAAGSSVAAVKAEHAAFKAAAKAAGITYQEVRSFETLFNGFSISLDAGQLGRLTQLSEVRAVFPVLTVDLPTVQTASPELATAIVMTGADIAQNELGLTGAGVKVAVMDTGIDYDHPDLGGCFGPGCRVAVGYDFVGDDYNADDTDPGYNPIPSPDPDPDDCQGHGTHVSGIVGADGTVVGVAPGVTFGAYRVFGCEGSTTADIMISAMERALADDMDILNMSIGSAFTWPQYPTAVASNLLVDAGMVVVASIGNSGASGAYSAGAPGLGEKVIGVASFDNTNVELSTFTITPDDAPIGFGVAAAAPLPPTSGTWPMARTGSVTTPDDACSPLPADSLAGHVALVRRGSCTFHSKALNAMNAGAVAVVLYNNVGGRFSPTVAGTPAITIPVVAISDAEGALIDGRLDLGPVDMTWTEESGVFQNPTAGLMSSFSSYGLAPDLSFKPDIGAPGGLIKSTYPVELGAFTTISGTSMASPHVAGAAALLLEARPGTPAELVRDIFQNSADPAAWSLNSGIGLMEPAHRQGAGMIDIDDAILQPSIITPGKIALGESEAGEP
ncbi:MAG: S8 family serine peptidase, partial [Acidimicrobiia bacterium]|nr:S8 family serine peptidase [Acidimicrobiia bacterium]